MALDGEATGDETGLPRLAELTAEQQRALAYASAIGREFDFPLLVAATGIADEALAEELERLVALGILRERPGGERFSFVHDEVRARIYQSLTASRLRVLHRKIAEAMARAFPEPPPEAIAELGRHFFLGKVPEKALVYNRRAAEMAQANDSPEEAAHLLERVRLDLKAVPGDHVRDEAELALRLGELYYSTGETKAADRLFVEALEKAGGDIRLRARILLGRAEVAREALDADAAVRGARDARELFARSGDVSGLASVHRILGRIAYQRGAYREAMDEGIRALDLLQPGGDPRVLGRLCIDIGDAFSMLGSEIADEAVTWYDRAVQRLGDVGDWAEVARAHVNRGQVLAPDRPADALDAYTLAREFAERAHEPRWVGWALARGVESRLALGQIEEGLQDNEQARRLLERADDPAGLELVLLNEGLVHERRGAWDQAEFSFRLAVERAQALGLKAQAARGFFQLARLLYKTRDLGRSREAFRSAVQLDLPQLHPGLAPAFAELGRQLAAQPDEGEPPPAPAGDGPAPPAARGSK